ncbi:hypothetical protein Dimus_032254 [Dionaea muscipula]
MSLRMLASVRIPGRPYRKADFDVSVLARLFSLSEPSWDPSLALVNLIEIDWTSISKLWSWMEPGQIFFLHSARNDGARSDLLSSFCPEGRSPGRSSIFILPGRTQPGQIFYLHSARQDGARTDLLSSFCPVGRSPGRSSIFILPGRKEPGHIFYLHSARKDGAQTDLLSSFWIADCKSDQDSFVS